MRFPLVEETKSEDFVPIIRDGKSLAPRPKIFKKYLPAGTAHHHPIEQVAGAQDALDTKATPADIAAQDEFQKRFDTPDEASTGSSQSVMLDPASLRAVLDKRFSAVVQSPRIERWLNIELNALDIVMPDPSLLNYRDEDGIVIIPFTDFSEYITAVAPTDWSTGLLVKSQANSYSGKILHADVAQAADFYLQWSRASKVADMEGLVLFKMPSAVALSANVIATDVRMVDTNNRYQSKITRKSSGTVFQLQLNKVVTGTVTSLGLVELPLAYDNWYWMRTRIEGSTLSTKIWSAFDDEQIEWDIQATSTSITADGDLKIQQYVSNFTDISYVSFALNGDEAHLPTGTGQLVEPEEEIGDGDDAEDTVQTIPVFAQLVSFVGSGSPGGGRIKKSDDGLTWVSEVNDSHISLAKIQFLGGKFIGVGGNNFFNPSLTGQDEQIYTSNDGVIWNSRRLGTAHTGSVLTWTAYGNGIYVAVGYINVGSTRKYYTSTDAITWTERTSLSGDDLYCIDFDGTRFITISGAGKVYSSTDGLSWTQISTVGVSIFSKLCYGNGKWVVCDGANNVFSSPNGVTWTRATTLPGGGDGIANLSFANNLFFIGTQKGFSGSNTKLMSSSDGLVWTTRQTFTANSAFNEVFNVIYVAGVYYCVVQSPGFTTPFNGFALISSIDGVSWSTRTTTNLSMGWLAYGDVVQFKGFRFTSPGVTELIIPTYTEFLDVEGWSGGGKGGNGRINSGNGDWGAGGGSGAYFKKRYLPGELTVGAHIPLLVGGPGLETSWNDDEMLSTPGTDAVLHVPGGGGAATGGQINIDGLPGGLGTNGADGGINPVGGPGGLAPNGGSPPGNGANGAGGASNTFPSQTTFGQPGWPGELRVTYK